MAFRPSIAYTGVGGSSPLPSESGFSGILPKRGLRFGQEHDLDPISDLDELAEAGADHFISRKPKLVTLAENLEETLVQPEFSSKVLAFNPQRPQAWVKLVSQVSRMLGPTYIATRFNGLSIQERAQVLSDKLWFSTLKTPLQDQRQQTLAMIQDWQTRHAPGGEQDFLQDITQHALTWVQAQLEKGTSPERLRQILTLGIETGLAGGNAKITRLVRQILSPQWKKTPPERQPMLLAETLGPLWVRLLQSRQAMTAFMQTPTVQGTSNSLSSASGAISAKKQLCAAEWDTRPSTLPFKTVQTMIERDLKASLYKAFTEFEEQPVAVTAMAQFHKAQIQDGLTNQPKEVLVKLLKPRIASLIAEDSALFTPLRRLLAQTYPELDQNALLEPVFKLLHPETDMRSEAKLRTLVGAALEKNSRLQVSQALPSHTGSQVLTMPWVDATALNMLPVGQQRRAAGHYLETMLEQVFKNPIYPTDPHPSHVALVHCPNNGTRQWTLRNAVDVSLSSEPERQQLARFLAAAYTGDVDLLIQQILPTGKGLSAERYQTLVNCLRPVLKEPVQKFTTPEQWQRWGKQLLQASQEIGSTSLALPSSGLMTALISSIMTAKQLDPGLNVWDPVSHRVAEVLLTADPILLARAAAVRLSRMVGG